jgi:hypothetical protein
MSTSPQRRKEDVPVWLWRLQAAEAAPAESRPRSDIWASAGGGTTDAPATPGDFHTGDHAVVVEQAGGERVLFLGSRVRPLARPEPPLRRLPWLEADVQGGQDPRPQDQVSTQEPTEAGREGPDVSPSHEQAVAEEVLQWREERDLKRRRMAMATSFVTYTERLHRSRRRAEILATVGEMAHRVLDASETLLLLPDPDGGDHLVCHHQDGSCGREGDAALTLPREALEGLGAPVILTQEAVDAEREPELAPLGGLLAPGREDRAASLAVAPMEGRGLLVVVERRRGRQWDDEDLFFLRSLARTAEERLRRVP